MIVELREYTLHTGARDTLIELFDRVFVEPQEAAGMQILGQFRDLDRPDRFVWIRSFPDMVTRAAALARFYGGPVWKAHREAANATMLDSSNVLLLRPAGSSPPLPVTADAPGILTATICELERPADAVAIERFETTIRPAWSAAGATPVAWYETEPAVNTFPALPVRTDVTALVWLSRVLGDRARELPVLGARVQHLRLAPTARSRLR